MARIERLKRGQKDRHTLHKPVEDCVYYAYSLDGVDFFQLDSFGSKDRADRMSVSQSIQLDRSAAAELIAALRASFPGLK
jgi:hypothetical protein